MSKFIRLCAALALPLPVLTGCGGNSYQVAEVSGTVTLDGKPLPGAWVTFLPVGTKENPNPGPTSSGKTDKDGRYKLSIDPEQRSAVVGKHKVWITTIDPGAAGGEERDAGGPVKTPKDKVPPRYNIKSELTFDVPPGGTDQANFDLKTK